MIKNFLVHGDCHNDFTWMMTGALDDYKPEETAIIILGDAGFDFYLNKTDLRKKKEVNSRGYRIYWVRGNHEARPQDVPGYEKIFDKDVGGYVYCNPNFPNLRAFMDYGIYNIQGYNCLVIGGAYSVDKYWRLERAMLTEETNNPKKTGWFANEQLSKEERDAVEKMIENFYKYDDSFDFVFTHTCPYSWEPRDLFLGSVDQSTVDNTMEHWLDDLKENMTWGIWCFGHFHADRLERPYVEQYYHDTDSLDTIYNRWLDYQNFGKIPEWIPKGPNFYVIN